MTPFVRREVLRRSTARAARAARIHLADAVGAVHRPAIGKVCILTAGRSGSEMLVRLLDAHPNMRCEGDILTHPRRDPRRHVRGRVVVAAYRRCAYGFKFNSRTAQVVTHRWLSIRHFIDALAQDGFSFIRLDRTDQLRRAVSHARAHETHTFHLSEADHRARVRIDPMLVIFNLRSYETHEELLDACMADKTVLRLNYETDLEDIDHRAEALSRVFALVGLDPVPIPESALHRTTPRSLSDAVENVDELVAALRGTRYEGYLTDLLN